MTEILVGRPLKAKGMAVRPHNLEKGRHDKGNDEDYGRGSKKGGFSMNSTSGSGFGSQSGAEGTWKHDKFYQHEKGFESGYGSNSNSTNGSFMQGGSQHSKGKKSYYTKKNQDSGRTRPPLNSNSFRQSREREREPEYLDKW